MPPAYNYIAIHLHQNLHPSQQFIVNTQQYIHLLTNKTFLQHTRAPISQLCHQGFILPTPRTTRQHIWRGNDTAGPAPRAPLTCATACRCYASLLCDSGKLKQRMDLRHHLPCMSPGKLGAGASQFYNHHFGMSSAPFTFLSS